MPDLSTLKPMRLLAACEEETSEQRMKLTHRLYHALWAEKKGTLLLFQLHWYHVYHTNMHFDM